MKTDAIISPCGLYRYRLSRAWGGADDSLHWIMLNPSTADANEDDPTIRRCIAFSKFWGYGGLVVLNLFALRSTDPKNLIGHVDPVGPLNNSYIVQNIIGKVAVAAWGKMPNKSLNGHPQQLIRYLRTLGVQLKCLGRNKDDSPKHPLYLAAETKLIDF